MEWAVLEESPQLEVFTEGGGGGTLSWLTCLENVRYQVGDVGGADGLRMFFFSFPLE